MVLTSRKASAKPVSSSAQTLQPHLAVKRKGFWHRSFELKNPSFLKVKLPLSQRACRYPDGKDEYTSS